MKKKLVVLTGAGMSVESGLSTFRDSGGLWDQLPRRRCRNPGRLGKKSSFGTRVL